MFGTGITKFLKEKFFTSPHELMVQKWYSDGGDFAMRFSYDLDENSVVFDLGGYKGQWASDLFSRYKCYIFVFEPVALFAEIISDRFKKNDQIQVFACGLSAKTRKEQINVDEVSSSLFGDSERTEEIELIDVKEWLEEKSISAIDLMKINIEGAEYELLTRLIEVGLVKNIKNIQIQFHNFSCDSRVHMEEIQRVLGQTHRLTYQYEFVWENWELVQ